MIAAAAVLLTVALLGAEATPVKLTDANFDAHVYDSGRHAFIKFFAPWCGHCKSIKPAWDELGEEFAASSSVLIGDVDCTEEKDLCSRFGVQGYPTLKYWADDSPKDGSPYSGGRTKDALLTFIKDTLEVPCVVATPETCTPKEQEYITKSAAKSPADASKELGRLEGMKDNKMTPDQKKWLLARINILKQLTKDGAAQ